LEAAPGIAGEEANIRVTHTHRDKEASPTINRGVLDRVRVERQLTLVKGLNVIEILTANMDARPGDNSETRRVVLHVEFEPDPVRILLQKIEPLSGGTPQRLDGKGEESVTVHSPRIRVTGVVETKGKPQAQWQSAEDKPVEL